MKNLVLKILMLSLTILTFSFTACNKKSRSTSAQGTPKELKQQPDEAIPAPKLNEAKEVVIETQKDVNKNIGSLFSLNDDLKAKNEGFFIIARKNDPGQAVTFAPQVQIVNKDINSGHFRKIDPTRFDDFTADNIKDVPATQQSEINDWREGNVYLAEFKTKFRGNKRAHKTAFLVRADEWDNNAEKVKLSYKFLSFGLE